MRIFKQVLPLLILLVALTGCSTAVVTNLSTKHQVRNSAGMYPIEAELDSHQQTLHWDSVTPTVIVETNRYPMQRTPLLKNRWETLIPISADTKVVYYRIKFDFNYTGMGKTNVDSQTSSTYRLVIQDQ